MRIPLGKIVTVLLKKKAKVIFAKNFNGCTMVTKDDERPNDCKLLPIEQLVIVYFAIMKTFYYLEVAIRCLISKNQLHQFDRIFVGTSHIRDSR